MSGADAVEGLPPAVARELGLDGPLGRRLDGGKVSEVWEASAGGRRVAVRRSPWFRTLPEVGFEHDAISRLHARGAPVARPVTEPILIEERVWTAFEWVDGSPQARPARDPYIYGRILGELHMVASEVGHDMAATTGQRPGWGRIDQFLTHRRGDACLADVLDVLDRQAGPAGARLAEVAVAVHERLAAAGLDQRPPTLAHGDFGPHQFLADPGGTLIAIVDWDFCHLDAAVADVAIATSPARPTAARAAAMLAGYLQVARLSVDELVLLPDLRRAFHLANLANWAVLWAGAGATADISPRLAVIEQRLDRERWWGPTLLAAVHEVTRRGRQHRPPPALVTPEELTDLDVAHELADRAAVVALHHFGLGVTATAKADTSPVTEADYAVELLLRDTLAELRPHDAILGEEFGSTAGTPAQNRTWVLDPIDGTSFFARGDPNWRIQIALMEGDDVTVAVVDAPALETRWWATRGGGATERTCPVDGVVTTRSLRTSAQAELDEAVVATYPRHVAGRIGVPTRPPPRSPLALVELVRGEIDAFYVDCCQIWDHAPWVLLVEEAGGRFTDHDGGRRPDRRGGLYSNAPIHDALLAAVASDRRRPP